MTPPSPELVEIVRKAHAIYPHNVPCDTCIALDAYDALTEERDREREQRLATEGLCDDVRGELERDNARLRAALDKYGQHLQGCPTWPTESASPRQCWCGLDAALTGSSA